MASLSDKWEDRMDPEDPDGDKYWTRRRKIAYGLSMVLFAAIFVVVQEVRSDAVPVCDNAVRQTSVSEREGSCVPIKRKTFRRHLKDGDYGNGRGILLPLPTRRVIRQEAGKSLARGGTPWWDTVLNGRACVVGGAMASTLWRGGTANTAACRETARTFNSATDRIKRATVSAAFLCTGFGTPGGVKAVVHVYRKVDSHWVMIKRVRKLVVKNYIYFAACTTAFTFYNIKKMDN